ncbi:MAG: hypothetical protein PWQ77_1909 [Kosmotogales bacterium]|nr:hypothetical protein [Kosmotogales bacterium]
MIFEKGTYVAFATPFKTNGEINFKTVEKLVEYYISCGIKGLFLGGTTGLGQLLSVEELKELSEVVVSISKKRIKTLILASRLTIEETKSTVIKLWKTGCDSITLRCPQDYVTNETCLAAYYEEILKDFPEIKFSFYYLKNSLSAETTMQLIKKFPNICAIKHSSEDFSTISRMIIPDMPVPVFIGYEVLALPAIKLGASGMVSGLGAALPKLVVSAFEATEKDEKTINKYHNLLVHSCDVLYKDATYGNIYRVLEIKGFDMGVPRLPVPERKKDNTELFELINMLEKNLGEEIQH